MGAHFVLSVAAMSPLAVDIAVPEVTNCPKLDEETLRQIDIDLPRTYSEDSAVATRRDLIRAVLVRQCIADVEVKYIQGMSFVAAAFALAYDSEDEVFTHFHKFVTSVRGFWLPGFPLVEEGTMHVEMLAESRPWFQHFRKFDVSPDAYLPRMWLPLFAKWLPRALLSQLVGIFESEGFAGVLAATLACLDHHGEHFLAIDSEEGLLLALRAESLVVRTQEIDCTTFLRAVSEWLPVVTASLQQGAGYRKPQTFPQTAKTAIGGRVLMWLGSKRRSMSEASTVESDGTESPKSRCTEYSEWSDDSNTDTESACINDADVTVRIVETESMDGVLYYRLNTRLHDGSVSSVLRRYSDFVKLDKVLAEREPMTFASQRATNRGSLPRTELVGFRRSLNPDKFLQRRLGMLQKYLDVIAAQGQDEEVQEFLHDTSWKYISRQ